MKPLRFFSGIALTALSLPIFAYAAPVDTLVGQLGGDNEKARSEARQLLPREGVSIIPKVLPLVSSENIHVWTAAFNTLSDVANEVSGPGRDADRTLATDYFMTLLAPEQPADIKIRGLRLVTITLPEGYIVSPIAALLTDADLRDKARSALQESGTDKACVALVRALRTADPAFQAALLDSIAFMKNETCAERVVRYTKSEAPIVRASAARAIAWTGDIKYIDEIRAVRVEADDATKFDADDAAIRFADARARNHADHATAITLYTEVLSTSKLYASRNAALVGLVRHGDSNTAATIVAALNGEGGRDLEPAVRSAFENATTENAKQVIVALYPQLSNEARLDILGAFGRKRDAAYIGLMTDGAQSSDAGVRVAAYTALADSQLLEAGPVLVAATAKATGEEKAAAVSELLRLAHALGAVGHTKEAGSAYFAA